MELKTLTPVLTFEKLKRYDLWRTFVVLFVNIIILFAVFGDMPLRLNQVSFAKDGDGVKSYYATMWHIRYDQSPEWFTGMNYPYGEHIFYTDSQPLLSNSIRWISHHIADISLWTPGIINSFLLISILIGAIFLYLVLRKAGVHFLAAIIGATALVWLTPQLGRLGGHFSLSYVCSLPGIILLLMLYAERPSWWRAILVAGWMLLMALTHFYFFGIAAVLLLVFWLYTFVYAPGGKRVLFMRLMHLVLQLVLPVLLVQLYVKLTDPVTGRPEVPFGFMFYRAYPESVFLPLQTPYFPKLGTLLQMRHVQWEGYAYVGLVGTLFFLGTVGFLISQVVKGKFRKVLSPFGDPFTGILFWAGTLALLYSWAVPFVFGLEGLLHYLGFVRQMRGVGRFAWLFFYGFNILIIIAVWRWHSARKSTFSVIAMAVILTILCADAWNNTRGLKNHIDNPFTLPEPEKGFRVDAKQYQAIVPLPYFHVGSENLWWTDDAGLLNSLMQISLANGIPTTGQFLSRTSIPQTFSQVEPFLPLNPDPQVFDRYDNRKLLLVSALNWSYASLYQRLIDTSKNLYANDRIRLSEISMEAYRAILSGTSKTISFSGGFTPVASVMVEALKNYKGIFYEQVPAQTCKVQVRMVVKGFTGDVVPRSGLQYYFRDEKERDLIEKWETLGAFLAGFNGDDGYLLATFEVPAGAVNMGLAIHNPDSKTRNVQIEEIGIRWIPCAE